MKTFSIKPADVQKKWLLIDAQDLILGRLAVVVANILRGKNKPEYTPHVDCGDNIVIVNAEKVKLTGKKETNRVLFTYSGYPGGQRELSPAMIRGKHPVRLIEHAVRGMLPKNTIGRQIYRSLHVYAGPNHDHEAQQPKAIKF